jgi:hypothetical protein
MMIHRLEFFPHRQEYLNLDLHWPPHWHHGPRGRVGRDRVTGTTPILFESEVEKAHLRTCSERLRDSGDAHLFSNRNTYALFEI